MQQELADRLSELTQAQRSFVLGILGAGLLRDWHEGGADQAARLHDLLDVARALDRSRDPVDEPPLEVDIAGGYTEWAPTYDHANAMVDAEAALVRSVLEPWLRPGALVLDAGCGTGRHATYFAGRGFRTVGVDVTQAMLRRAQATPGAAFVRGDLEALPLRSRSVDAAVCSLALCHLPELGAALRELARVLMVGGRLVVSDPHGRAAYAGGQGFYGAGGLARPRFVRNHHRQASEWIQAFTTAGFVVETCLEPRMDAASAGAHPVAALFPDATRSALVGVPYLWIWSVTTRND